MLPRVVVDMVVAAHNHNEDHKVDASVCRADHACVDESQHNFGRELVEFVIRLHWLGIAWLCDF